MAVIGWILLTILGLLLFLILLILFFPISYKIEGRSQKEIPVVISARAYWLFGFVRVLFDYPKPSRPIAKIAFFTVFGKEGTNKKNSETTESEKEQSGIPEQSHEVEQSDAAVQASDTNESHEMEASSNDEPSEVKETANDQDQLSEQTAKEDADDKAKKGHSTKTKQKFSEKFQKIKKRVSKEYHFYKKLWQDEDTKPFVKDTLARVFHILKNVLPKRVSGSLHFGAASPDVTGYVFGIYCMISSLFTKRYNFTLVPEFEDQVLEGEFLIKGHFCTFTLLWDGLRIFFDRRLKKIRKRIEKHQEKMSQIK